MPDIYLPAGERRDILRDYGLRYGIRHFVETGTADGDTCSALRFDFDWMLTIELDENFFKAAQQRFGDAPHIHCVHGDSGQLIPQIVHQLTAPTLFWLDGHYCGGARAPDTDTPVETELEYCTAAPKGSVILVDDARLFGGGPEHTEEFKDYPDLTWVEELALKRGFDYKLANDIIRLTPPMTPVERFLAKVNKRGPRHPRLGYCWVWTHPLRKDGYASFWLEGRQRYAHCVAYEFWVGPIPEGKQLDHLCRRRHCIHPSHLEPVTQHENLRRSGAWEHWRAKTHCPHGHPYDEENTFINAKGSRMCRTCTRERTRAWRKKVAA